MTHWSLVPPRGGLIMLILSLLALGGAGPIAAAEWRRGLGYQTFVIGDELAPVPDPRSGGFLLNGGGDWNRDAFRWFTARAGHGHLVVLRASGATESQDEFYHEVRGLQSVRTFVFSARQAASDPRILAAVRAADALFIAGGDQANYVRMWRGTPLNAAIDAHVAAGKPLGGTSAGLAILGAWVYGAMDGGSITSGEALLDPLGGAVTVEHDFLHVPLFAHVFTDSHFDTRERLGRLIAFLIKTRTLDPHVDIAGLGVDEDSALTVEPDGTAHFYASAAGKHAWLVRPGVAGIQTPGKPLNIDDVQVTGIGAASTFNVRTLEVGWPTWIRSYTIVAGVLKQRMHWSLAIHGGAGIVRRGNLTPEREADYRGALRASLAAGQAVLEKGGAALDAIQAALVVLEDDPHFNAGKGAAIAADGNCYLDAAIMDGASMKAGAVASLTRTRNPILAARAVMERSPHVLLAGDGADAFSVASGLTQVDPAYFHTPERDQMYRDWQKNHAALPDPAYRHGTVGAVALDSDGHLAAATSTGGLTGKQWGRIGDSPLIGAGTYARDGDCAVSATGTGEYFIRDSAARQACDRVRWNHEDIEQAAYDTIMSVGSIGGDGGLIAMDADGHAAFAINDEGMYRGSVSSDQPTSRTAIYRDDALLPPAQARAH